VDQLLVAVVADPVEEEGVALREHRRRKLGRPLRREHESQAELASLPRDALEHLAADGSGVLVL
jgi:hypothetical protein